LLQNHLAPDPNMILEKMFNQEFVKRVKALIQSVSKTELVASK